MATTIKIDLTREQIELLIRSLPAIQVQGTLAELSGLSERVAEIQQIFQKAIDPQSKKG